MEKDNLGPVFIEDDEISLIEILATLWKYRKFLLIFNVLVLITSIGFYVLKHRVNKVNTMFRIVQVESFPIKDNYSYISTYISNFANEIAAPEFQISDVKLLTDRILTFKITYKRTYDTSLINKTLTQKLIPIYTIEHFRTLLEKYKAYRVDYYKALLQRTNSTKNYLERLSNEQIYGDIYIDKVLLSLNGYSVKQSFIDFLKQRTQTALLEIKQNKQTPIFLQKLRIKVLELAKSIYPSNLITIKLTQESIKKSKVVIYSVLAVFFGVFISFFIVFIVEYIKSNKDEILEAFKKEV